MEPSVCPIVKRCDRPGSKVGIGHERCARAVEYVSDPRPERQASLGWLDPLGMTDEQRVVEQVPQAGERMADCGLADIEALSRASDVPLVHEGLEHNQQIQVDTAKIDTIHDVDVYYAMDSSSILP